MFYGNNNNQSAQMQRDLYNSQKELLRLQQEAASRPQRPEWESLLGDDGLLQQPYQMDNAYNSGALDQMRQDNLRAPGEQSAWRALQGQKLQGDAANSAAQAQGNIQAGMNQLAMRGGLRSGAGERMATAGARNADLARQGVMGQRINLDIQDEQMRTQGLGQLNAAELQSAQNAQGVQQFNIGNSLNDITQKRYADLEAYKEQMQAWASERTAEATPSGGGGKK